MNSTEQLQLIYEAQYGRSYNQSFQKATKNHLEIIRFREKLIKLLDLVANKSETTVTIKLENIEKMKKMGFIFKKQETPENQIHLNASLDFMIHFIKEHGIKLGKNHYELSMYDWEYISFKVNQDIIDLLPGIL